MASLYCIIYERKADLSPNGTTLVYPAAKFHGPIPDWVAVSKPPFLTAFVLWQASGACNLLSLFDSNTRLALGQFGHEETDLADGFAVPPQFCVTSRAWPSYFDILPDHGRMLRDGWHVHAGSTVYNPARDQQAPIFSIATPCQRRRTSNSLQGPSGMCPTRSAITSAH